MWSMRLNLIQHSSSYLHIAGERRMVHIILPEPSEVVHGRFQLVGWPVRLVPITNATLTNHISSVLVLFRKIPRLIGFGPLRLREWRLGSMTGLVCPWTCRVARVLHFVQHREEKHLYATFIFFNSTKYIDRCLPLPAVKLEYLVSMRHHRVQALSLLFVHTARRSYWLVVPVNSRKQGL